MGCKDPLVAKINKLRYNLVELPRVGILPLDVLGRDGHSFERLGSITEVWSSSREPAPAIGPPQPAASVDGEKTSDIDVAIGLQFLSKALAGLGASIGLPTLNTGFKSAKKLEFRFANVNSVSVSPFALGKYLASGSLDMTNPFVRQYFGNTNTEEYIIFDVLQSNSIGVTPKDERGGNVAADINALQSAITASVKINANTSSSSSVTFEGSSAATFAFKLYEIFYENGQWTPKGVAPSDDFDFGVGDEKESEEAPGVLLSEGRMTRIRG